MALERTFRWLLLVLQRLYEGLSALHVTIGDKPPNDESAVADALENTVLDIMGRLHEIRKFALQAQKAVAHPTDLERARQVLALCQKHFHRIEQEFASDLVSYDKLKELVRLGNERRGWLPWASSIKQGIEQCRGPLEETSTSLAQCWQELAERLGTVNISMKAVNIGQQTTAKRPRADRRHIGVRDH
jgi:hypothetical protein